MRKIGLITLLAAGLASGCATAPDGTQQPSRAGTGAILGALGGAVVGNNMGDGKNRTAVGAIIGAGIGAAIGNSMDEQEKEFNRQLASEQRAHEIEVERVRDDLLKLTVSNEVSFDFDRADIRPSFGGSLDKIASVLLKHNRSRVMVVGHTDSHGSDAYNRQLSERRARQVGEHLVSKGVERSRLTLRGAGESEPRAGNNSEAGRQLNRRVEIFIQPQ